MYGTGVGVLSPLLSLSLSPAKQKTKNWRPLIQKSRCTMLIARESLLNRRGGSPSPFFYQHLNLNSPFLHPRKRNLTGNSSLIAHRHSRACNTHIHTRAYTHTLFLPPPHFLVGHVRQSNS